jgi:hypothetical protein
MKGWNTKHKKLKRRPTLVGQIYGHESPKWSLERFNHLFLGWSDAYDTEFQPVSLWARGSNKMKWSGNQKHGERMCPSES